MGDMEPKLPFYPFMFRNTLVRQVFVYTMPNEAKRQACDDLVRAMEEGRLTFPIAARYGLDGSAGGPRTDRGREGDGERDPRYSVNWRLRFQVSFEPVGFVDRRGRSEYAFHEIRMQRD